MTTIVSQPLKMNIRRITTFIIDKITDMGFNVWIGFSKHSRSRYLDIHTGLRVYVVRISDHPLKKSRGRYDYDIYTDRPRRGAKSYTAFLESFGEQIKADRRRL
jgi:hypothetical protein